MKKYTLYLFVLLSSISTNAVSGQGVVINEVQSSNSSTIEDENGNNEDWIELYNNGLTEVNLSGYGLSDDPALPHKWNFPNVVLGSKKYLLIWLSDKNIATAGSPLHTNFKLSSEGEVVSLTNTTGTVVDKVTIKGMRADISYGRLPNGTGAFVFFGDCTPKAVNSMMGYSDFLQPPTFSVKSGFFTQAFNLVLSSSVPGTTILYTLDGSEPNPNNLGGTTYSYKNQYAENPGQATGPLLEKSFRTLKYSTPITIVDRSPLPNKIASISSTYHYKPYYIPQNPIFKGTVVRAKTIKAGALSSTTSSKSYFISPQGSARFKLPVISLSVNENDFFDYDKGIYVAGVDFDKWRAANPSLQPGTQEGIGNYFRREDVDEKLTNMTYLVNGIEVVNQDLGISIHGGGTRHMQSKSLGVYTRAKYGRKSINYKLFSDLENTNFERLTLNISGQDFLFTMFRDALNHELCKSLHCETEAYQPTVTFINGEYWGILNIREKYTDKYFAEIYNIGKNELDFIEVPDYEEEGDNIDYLDMTDFFEKNSLADNTNYNYIKTRLDTESFGDFFIANIFFQNADFPGNNVQCWRKKTNGYIADAPYGHDGRWRWAFHDMDATFTFGSNDDVTTNSLAKATALNGSSYPNPEWSTLFLRKMLDNNEFRNYFINRFADLMNTAFLSSRIISKMDAMKAVIEPEIGEHISRWKKPNDVAQWNNFLKRQQDFANARPAMQREHIKTQFNISKTINATLDVSNATQGYIKMNTIDILSSTVGVTANPYPWTGIYYSNIPVKIKAIPLSGYVFSHWSGASSSTKAEITLTPTADFPLTAHFAPSSNLESKIIYFWLMNDLIKDDVPLTSLNSTYHLGGNVGVLNYYSCLVGYPFTPMNLNNYRKADMERADDPTTLNYLPLANHNIPYAAAAMKGIQITQPFRSGTLENNLIFSISSVGFKNIKFGIAAKDGIAATGILLEYSTNPGNPVWKTSGIAKSSFSISSTYQLIDVDFTNIEEANNNPNFKIRLRFTGPNMTVVSNGKVLFNNVSVQGTPTSLGVDDNSISNFVIYPNPANDVLKISSHFDLINYKLFSANGKTISNGQLDSGELNISFLPSGLYILHLTADEKTETKTFIKN